MLGRWQKTWKEFEKAPAGERFEQMYRRRKGGPAARVGLIALGILLIAGGAVLLVIPGPGLPLIAVGAAFIAQQFLVVARALDRLELFLRRQLRAARAFWKRASTGLRSAVVAAAALFAAGAAYGAYVVLFAD